MYSVKCIQWNHYSRSLDLDIVADNWEALVEDDYIRIFPLNNRQKRQYSLSVSTCFQRSNLVFFQEVS